MYSRAVFEGPGIQQCFFFGIIQNHFALKLYFFLHVLKHKDQIFKTEIWKNIKSWNLEKKAEVASDVVISWT